MLSPREGEGLAVNVDTHSHKWSTFGDRPTIANRSGVTELPRLTSDPICTEDRRGEILISFGRSRTLRGVLNPFEAYGYVRRK